MRSKRILVVPVVVLAGLAALWPTPVEAQRRGGVRGGHARVSVVVGAGSYAPYYYGWYGPYRDAYYWGGWYPWSPWGFYPQYPYYAARWEESSAAKTLVTPKETQVYVDGYLVGTADDFDGVFQSLRLPPGDHEIQLYLEGYRTVSQKVSFRTGETYKLRHTMVPLGPGEAAEPKPVPAEPPPTAEPRAPRAPRAPIEPREPYGPRPPFEPRGPESRASAGVLSIRVQPGNAEVFIDGEQWEGPEGSERLEVQVPEGAHRVEVRKEGYEPFSTEVRVRRGEESRLNVSLPRIQGL